MSSSRLGLQDLLRPSLDESADPVRMRAAWNPWQLAVLSFLGGPLTAGYLYGENFRRLGNKRASSWCFLGSLGLTLLVGLLGGMLLGTDLFADAADREARIAAGLARALALFLILPLSYAQQKRFRVFTRNGGETGALLLSGGAALLVGGLAGNLVVSGVMRWMA